MIWKLFYRLFGHQKLTWVLNVLCLSVAFAVLFIVLKQVRYDFSYDTCYPESENIYQLGYYNATSGRHEIGISFPFIQRIVEPIPEIESYTVLWYDVDGTTNLYQGETEYQNVRNYRVRPGFSKVFQPHIIAGDAEEALESGNGLLIPQSLAKKSFENENPIGKSIGFGQKTNLWTIKAVYEDFPENSSMPNGIIYKLDDDTSESEWSYTCYFRVHKGVNKDVLEQKMIHHLDSVSLAMSNGEYLVSERLRLELRAMEDMYFSSSGIRLVIGKQGNLSLTLCLLITGILIVLVAYINFINFSTALAPSRIGTFNICKMAGASNTTLRKCVIGEAVLLSVIAYVIAFFWVEAFSVTALAKAYFNASIDPLENIGLFSILGVGALVSGILAGLYPACYMTSFQPALVLKGSFALSGSGRRLRNGLLLFQFVVTIILIIASLFVFIQHHYLINSSWGYQKENIVYAPVNQLIRESQETFRTDLMKNPAVLDVTASRFIPGYVPMGWGRSWADTLPIQFMSWPVASNFLSFFGISVYEGDTLSEPPAGKDYGILNRKMVEKFGLQRAIGGLGFSAFENPVTVIGFAENVNFASLKNEIEPMAFICGDDMWNDYVFMKIRPERIHETMDYIKGCFAKFGNDHADLTFLEDYIGRLYEQEENLSQLILLFCAIIVVISLAGIYGLILFNIRYKVKEVGIRKINGATEKQVLWMLNRVFIKLVMWGFVIACPVAYLLVNEWFKQYAYHSPIYWWVFVIALLLTLGITFLTVWYQSRKAANANPVDVLKTE